VVVTAVGGGDIDEERERERERVFWRVEGGGHSDSV